MSSQRQDWQTPENVLDLVRAVGPIELDPCTTLDNPVGARNFYTPSDDGFDGLALPWDGPGVVFVNPPYGRASGDWCKRMADAGARGVEVIGLLPARTDTRVWHAHVTTAATICFWKGRITFRGAPGPAPFPCALPYWGPRVDEFRRVFSARGWCT